MKNKSILQAIQHPLFSQHKVRVSIKRDDQIHPIISGNKWRKLYFNLRLAKSKNYQGIISFGGCYSNHIHALAFACRQQNLKCIAYIRGEESSQSNYTLSWAKHWGMTLIFLDRKTYKQRQDESFLKDIQQQYPDYFIVPEGGSNQLALQGVGEVITELNQQCTFDTLLAPVGSGGTLAGLIKQDNNQHDILGIAVLKQSDYLHKEVNNLLGNEVEYRRWSIINNYHGGGYAKFSADDAQRILQFSNEIGIPFEPIYTGKMLLALLGLLAQGYFKVDQHIVLLHTGGLQGIAGLIEQGRLNPTDWLIPPEPPA
ncbi:MAG: 1-aminocyclopropane-1-carboxylate deaminase/D-cysteine desulfhydrase [Thalassotalea sp.]